MNKICEKIEQRSTEILKLSHEGRGVAKILGKTIFLEGGLPGEQVEFKYKHKRNRFSEGHVTQVFNPSIHRVPPQCPYAEICGGCSLQHMAEDFQIEHKQAVLLEHLEHIAQIKPLQILPPITGPIFGYRRKARLSVRYVEKKQKLLIGFREKEGHYLTDMDHCAILDPRIGFKISELKQFLQGLPNHKEIPQIEIAAGDHAVALIFRHLVPLTSDEQLKLADFGKNHNFQIYLQDNSNQVELLYPKSNTTTLSYHLPDYDLKLFFHPLDFIQINGVVNQHLVHQAMSLLSPRPGENILDLFCGLGNFSLPLAKHGCNVTAVEGSPEMVQRGQANANHHSLYNIHFKHANLDSEISNQPWYTKTYQKILLDPPRTGALNIVKQINCFNPQKILYISCNSATFARDAKVLSEQKYLLTSVGVVNMFPHTKHIECIGLFEKQK